MESETRSDEATTPAESGNRLLWLLGWSWLALLLLIAAVLVWGMAAVSRVLLWSALVTGVLAGFLTVNASMARSASVGGVAIRPEDRLRYGHYRRNPEAAQRATSFGLRAAAALFGLTALLVAIGLGLRALA